uniref:Uncharacterized protein n=1 Tax=Cyprinus carpio TaxID=7962 RepID=A0A8C1WCX2_CYPCA
MALLKCIALLCPFLFFAQICSMPTKCIMRRKLVKETHKLLENMGGLFPRECLKENVEITFPTSALQSDDSNQDIGVKKATYKIMEHIDYLFANDSHPVSWNQKKVEDFQNIVYRFTDDYTCIMTRKQRPEDDFLTREGALKTYFDKLATLLRNKVHQTSLFSMHKIWSTKHSNKILSFKPIAYYKLLSFFLLQDYSDCAWEVVRKELMCVLKLTLKLVSFT